MGHLETLQKYFGYDSFRGVQEEIITSILAGHDTLGLMPTGGGKSITFQVPALMMDGVCIVITPLIALMKDQVMHLKQRGIKAEAIYAGLTHQEIQRILDNAIYGAVKFLYVSPERLHTKIFQAKLYHMKVCFITVDEAHCISQWGYDFRPSYLKIRDLRELKPEAPILALTASATPTVIDDIQEKLSLSPLALSPERERESICKIRDEFAVYKMSFKRDNLSYVVRKTEDEEKELLHILRSVPGSAIVYCNKRKDTKEIAQLLNDNDIKSTFYHAGLDIAIKDTRQEEWQQGIYQVMVATNAFGMGIDKPDVRLVIHLGSPTSLEEYYQEAGRGGRDGKRSYAVLISNPREARILMDKVDASFPAKDKIREIYDKLAYYFQQAIDSGQGARYEFDIDLFCYKFHEYPSTVEAALSILQNAGYLEYNSEPQTNARVMITIPRHELYNLHGLTPEEDSLLSQMMRLYGSLFTELTYISEEGLAHFEHIDQNHLHVYLKGLAQKHIIRYVPKRRVPTVTYVQQRIDSSLLRFPKAVYEELKDKAMTRAQAMVDYINNTSECRSTMLLRYFGEESSEACHHCDICLKGNKPDTRDLMQHVLDILSDGKKHSIHDLPLTDVTQKERQDILEQLRNDDRIMIKDTFIILKE